MPDVTLNSLVDAFLVCTTQAGMRAALGTLTAAEIATAIATGGLTIGSSSSPIASSTLTASGAVTFSSAGAVTISPSNTVTISPSGILIINPSSSSTLNNTSVGATTRSTGAFTSLAANSAVTLTAGTASTTTGTGTLVVTGGVGISGALFGTTASFTTIAGSTGTFSGRVTISVAGAASAPGEILTGAIFTGGTGTTTFPHLFLQPAAATAVTTWNTAGTLIGGNSATGFTGNFLDFRVNGAASGFSVSYLGNIAAPGATFSGTVSGASSGLALAAGGTDQNISLTPSGIGITQVVTGRLILGAATSAGVGFRNDGAMSLGTQITAVDGDASHYAVVGGLVFLSGANGYLLSSSGAPNIIAVGLSYSASGMAEINNGTVGTFNDLKLRRLVATGPVTLASFTVSTVPLAASYVGSEIYVSNESGGATPAFSDGTNWRRYADRAIIS